MWSASAVLTLAVGWLGFLLAWTTTSARTGIDGGDKKLIVISAFRQDESDQALLLFRSLWNFHDQTQVAADACMARGSPVTASNKTDDEVFGLVGRFARNGVRLHVLDDISVRKGYSDGKNDTAWLNLVCLGQIADIYGGHYHGESLVVVLSASFVVVGDLLARLLPHQSRTGPPRGTNDYIVCTPKLVSRVWVGATTASFEADGMCEMDLLAMPVRMGSALYAALNATSLLNISASQALTMTARSVSSGILFFDGSQDIVRSARPWYRPIDIEANVVLIEFDGIEHKITVQNNKDSVATTDANDCMIYVHIEWPDFNTVGVISRIFNSRIYSSRDRINMLAGCAETPVRLEQINKVHSVDLDQQYTPRVFDTVIFNDELALLQLRLEYLRDHVDFFVIVEASKTFTGKAKELHFNNVKDSITFAPYRQRIIHVVLREMLFENVTVQREVWLNEYFSRNSIDIGLQQAGIRNDDIIILADVDEIPHPRAIQTLRSLVATSASSASTRPLIYKLYPLNYLYNFDCYVGDDEILHSNAASAGSYGAAKQLSLSFSAVKQQEQYHHQKHNGGSTDDHNFLTLMRMYRQRQAGVYPYEHVLYPGSWHLSFFGGVEKIKSKLQSYSHQNFVRQFIDPSTVSNNNASCVAGSVGGEECVLASGQPVYDDHGNEIIPQRLPQGEISTDLIKSKIAAGLEVDNRNRRRCRSRDPTLDDPETIRLKAMWHKISSPSIEAGSEAITIERRLRVAIVSGHIGEVPTFVPAVPHSQRHAAAVHVDCYFISNNQGLLDHIRSSSVATNSDGGPRWIPIFLGDIPLLSDSEGQADGKSVDVTTFYTRESKKLKVFPQQYLPVGQQYDFVLWFDNKFDLNTGNVLSTIVNSSTWGPGGDSRTKHGSGTSMMLHKKPSPCCGADLEYRDSLLQPRYAQHASTMKAYIDEQVALGYHLQGDPHFQTGFIIYNMRNLKQVREIQDLWYDHIRKVGGLHCQIAFYFVAQIRQAVLGARTEGREGTDIREFELDWNYGRKTIHHMPDEGGA
jgi:beta-1,4-mannosyl-glycoprotein beta-1,4-N-acetylglucosaminyltransferase